jgi:hypothetical protein
LSGGPKACLAHLREIYTTKGEPNDLYDSLSQEARPDTWDFIGSLGYTPEQGAAGMWWARKTGSKHAATVGPIESLAALLPAVKEEIRIRGEAYRGPAVMPTSIETFEDVNQNSGGITVEARLPGMEEPDIEELNGQADICLDLKKKRENLNTAWEDACDLMRSKMRDHGRKRYKRHGYPFVIEESEKLVIKKLEDKAPKNPSTRKLTKR